MIVVHVCTGCEHLRHTTTPRWKRKTAMIMWRSASGKFVHASSAHSRQSPTRSKARRCVQELEHVQWGVGKLVVQK